MITNDMLSAYLDGELPETEAERVRRAVAADELLAARLRRFEQVDAMLRDFCGGIEAEPMPAGVLQALGSAPAPVAVETGATPVVDLAAARRRAWRLPLALAASLLVAVLAGVVQLGRESSATRSFERVAATGAVAPDSPLHAALERAASAEEFAAGGAAGLRISPQLSFVSGAGEFCREFLATDAARAVRGVACRQSGGWQTLRVAAVSPGAAGGDYATAAADSDPQFDAFVDALIAQGPLGADEEAGLIARGWRAGY